MMQDAKILPSIDDIKKLFPRTEHARKMKLLNAEFFALVESSNFRWDDDDGKYYDRELYSSYEEYEQDMRYEQWKEMRESMYDSD